LASRNRKRGQLLAVLAAASFSIAAFSAGGASAATIQLDNLTDEIPPIENDVCSFREALDEANSDSPVTSLDCIFTGTLNNDTILLPAGTLTYTGPDESAIAEDVNQSGDFDAMVGIGASLTVQGAGRNATTIDMGAKDRAFDLKQNSSSVLGSRLFTLKDITVTNGYKEGFGGGVRALGVISEDTRVALDHAVLTGNRATSGGGGFYGVAATLDLFDSSVNNNRAAPVAPGAAQGGGIYVTGNNNGPGGVNAHRSTISNNNATGQGGGVYVLNQSRHSNTHSATFVDTAISGNTVTPPSGAGRYAGLLIQDASVTMRNSLVSNNRIVTTAGGGSGSGAGMAFSDTSPNFPSPQNTNDHLDMDNVTFTDNDAGPNGSGDPAGVGGLTVSNGISKLANLTFFNNESGGVTKDFRRDGSGNGVTFSMRSSILGTPGACPPGSFGTSSAGNNIEVGGETCGFLGGAGSTPGANGDIENATPAQLNLQELDNNGGPTRTVALGAGSTAINHIPAADCLNSQGLQQETDQRGISRVGSDCDVGAFEVAFCQGASVTVIGTDGDDVLEGTAGDDVVAALDGNDQISSFGGADKICAGDGDDNVNPGPDQDDDVVQGEAGLDTLNYSDATTAVDVDLAAGTADGQGTDAVPGFEHLIGSDNDDSLSGTSDANDIWGGDGVDTVAGLDGADNIFVRDGLGDSVTCGDGDDTVQSDVQGTDSLSECETASFMPTPQPPPVPPAPVPTPNPNPNSNNKKPTKPKKCKKPKKGKKKKKKKKGCKKK
jgi:hypothetical protein